MCIVLAATYVCVSPLLRAEPDSAPARREPTGRCRGSFHGPESQPVVTMPRGGLSEVSLVGELWWKGWALSARRVSAHHHLSSEDRQDGAICMDQ